MKFFEKNVGFSTHLGHCEKMFYLETTMFLFKRRTTAKLDELCGASGQSKFTNNH